MKNVYFLGIGGIGMSAIARYYKHCGLQVSGYDRTPSPLTARLEAEGIAVHYDDNPARIPADKAETLVIYTPAIPESLQELQTVRREGYRLLKRSQMLGEIARDKRCLAVSGTHGKTTTSTLLAHILTVAGTGCSAFLGGISKNYDSNLITGRGDFLVAEADEFDRSFLQLFPEVAVVTAMDADHLDIYGDLAHVQEAFRAFAAQVSGTLIAKWGLPLRSEDTPARLLHYSYDNPEADFYASDIRRGEDGCFSATLHHPGGVLEDFRCGTPGRTNLENAVAATAVALSLGSVDPQLIRRAVGSFRGVQRRFDVHVNTPTLSYIDDYAHHPQELACAIRSIRDIFPGRKITAIFQPHLYTRTRDFAPEFARALSGVDKLILLEIYPAREEPIPGVDAGLIFKDVTAPEKVRLDKSQLMDYLAGEKPDVLVTFGAGDVDRFIDPITRMLQERIN